MAFNRDRNSNKQSFSSSRSGGDRGGFRPRPSFNDRGRSGGFSRGPVEMYQAVCDNCGKECQVPFRPTQGKPVFCSDCFRNQKEGSERPNFGDRRPDQLNQQPERREQPNNEAQFQVLNTKLDNILKILESVSEEVETESLEEEIAPKVEKKKRASKKAASLPQE